MLMELIDNILNDLSNKSKQIMIINYLDSIYTSNPILSLDNNSISDYAGVITTLTRKITNLLDDANNHEESLNLALLENDYETLLDVFDEYKEYMLPVLPVVLISLINSLSVDDIKYLQSYQLQLNQSPIADLYNKFIIKSYSFVPFLSDTQSKIVKDNLTISSSYTSSYVENILHIIKSYDKLNKDNQLHFDYLQLLALYFNMLVKRDSNV